MDRYTWGRYAQGRGGVGIGWGYSPMHKAAGLPAAVQNDLWTWFCMAVPHRHFSVLQGTAG